MASYTKSQRIKESDKPHPTVGNHSMTITFEVPNKKNEAMHSFVLENAQFKCWHNIFLSDLDKFAEACSVKEDAAGMIHTGEFKGKSLEIVWGKAISRAGKEYEGVLSYGVDLGAIPF